MLEQSIAMVSPMVYKHCHDPNQLTPQQYSLMQLHIHYPLHTHKREYMCDFEGGGRREEGGEVGEGWGRRKEEGEERWEMGGSIFVIISGWAI